MDVSAADRESGFSDDDGIVGNGPNRPATGFLGGGVCIGIGGPPKTPYGPF